MQVALIGDIHANLPALEAVLAHIQEQGIENMWNVGDFVGYGAFPDEVVQLFRTGQGLLDEDVLSIVGNYDLKVLKFKQKKEKWRKRKTPEKYLAFKFAYEQLSKKNRKYLRFLSQQIRVKINDRRVLLVHGSPESNEEHLTPDTPKTRLHELAEKAKADVIVCGHSHQPFVRDVDGVWFINTGSVGRSDDGDPRACYAVAQIDSDQVLVQHHRIDYDMDRAVAAIHEQKLPEAFAQMILQGRDLDTVLAAMQD
jgi:putative phosphoesterase